MTSSYPFDPTGFASTNLVRAESHVITERNDNTYRVIVPKFAPFYLDSVKVVHIDVAGVRTTLTEGVDYTLVMPYVGATRSIGKSLYGAFSIHTKVGQGMVEVDYRTLGGTWTADREYVLEQLFIKLYNPRVVWWDQITNVQETFPPINHTEDITTLYTHRDVLDRLDAIISELHNKVTANPMITLHSSLLGNPHGTTPADLGLGNVANIGVASQADINTLAKVEKLITLKQMIETDIIRTLAGTDQLVGSISTAKAQAVTEAVDKAKAAIDRSHIGLTNVQDLPTATNTDILDQNRVRKYVTLDQVLTLFDLKKEQT